jgi:hypothetical protein
MDIKYGTDSIFRPSKNINPVTQSLLKEGINQKNPEAKFLFPVWGIKSTLA